MPRPGPRRPLIALRISEGGIAAVDKMAATRGLNRSEMLRLMLAYATEHMPATYQPNSKSKP